MTVPDVTPVHAEPNVTPMIDVLLVLLIIFMLMAPLQQKVITAQLQPDTGPSDRDAPAVVLDVGPKGAYAVDREPVLAAALGARLRAIYAGRRAKTIIVRGDPRATYQEVVTAMDVARGAGVRVIGLHPKH